MARVQRRWSSLEDAILREEVEAQLAAGDGKANDWNSIAKKIPDRTNKDCRKRYYNGITDGLKKGLWTEQEDRQLQEIVGQYGQVWAVVSSHIKTRSADQCAKRWAHILDPALDRSQWRDDEISLLICAVKTHGTTWKDIQQLHFPNRAANNIKNQHTLIRRKMAELPAFVPPCCSKSSRESEGQTTAPEPSSTSQQQLTEAASTSGSPGSSDVGGETMSHFSDSGVEMVPQIETLSGPNEPCFCSTLASRRLETTFDSTETSPSCEIFPDDCGAIEPQTPFSEHVDFTQLLSSDGNLPEFDQMDLSLGTDLAIPDLSTTPFDPSLMDVTTREPSTPACRSFRANIELEDVEPATVSSIMSILIHSKARVKFEMQDEQA